MSSSAAAVEDPINQRRLSAMLGDNSFAVRLATATKAPPLAVLRSAQMLVSPKEKHAFAAELVGRLGAAGVDTSDAIAFEIGSRGHVQARDGTPGKRRIDALFAGDPVLESTYRRIVNTEELKAQVREMSRYTLANASARSKAERDALWRHYAAIFASMLAVRGQLILTEGTVESPAFDFVSGPLRGPFDQMAAAGVSRRVAGEAIG